MLVTGPTGLGQIDDAVRADRPDQPDAHRSRHHDRRPDRVRPSEQEVRDHAASGGCSHRVVQARAPRGASRRPRHCAGRRAARSRDGIDRHRDGGDRTPGVRHAAHDDGPEHHRPARRSVPGRSPGADPRDALGVAQGRDLAGALQEDRRWSRRGARDPAVDESRSRTSFAKRRRSRSPRSCRRRGVPECARSTTR